MRKIQMIALTRNYLLASVSLLMKCKKNYKYLTPDTTNVFCFKGASILWECSYLSLVELHLVSMTLLINENHILIIFLFRLNEGFAQLLQYTLVDTYYPEWRMHDFMNIFALQGNAFRTDARATTRQMTKYALTPTEVGSLFDNIAYDKCELSLNFNLINV
jgi:hypothetical protein